MRARSTRTAPGPWRRPIRGSSPSPRRPTSPARPCSMRPTWTNADGTTGIASIPDNVEVFAPGSPIFAVSQEDHLTGSSGADLFVFGQPISHDTLHSFDAAADRIDLIGFDGVNGFAISSSPTMATAMPSSPSARAKTITVLGVSAAATRRRQLRVQRGADHPERRHHDDRRRRHHAARRDRREHRHDRVEWRRRRHPARGHRQRPDAHKAAGS